MCFQDRKFFISKSKETCMAKETDSIDIVKYYSSLRFWGCFILLLYATEFLYLAIQSRFDLVRSARGAAFIILVMPGSLAFLLESITRPFGLLHNIVRDILVLYGVPLWPLQIIPMLWLRFKTKLSRRSVVIIGTILLFLLIAELVSCNIIASNLGRGIS